MYKHPSWRYGLLIACLSIPLFVLQFRWCQPALHIPNVEATWHVIHTANSLASNSLSSHWLLPTLTLGNPLDKGIPWGLTTVPTQSGNFIYTSFYSPGFIFAALARLALPGMDSFKAIVVLNVLLGIASSVLLYLFVYKALGCLDLSRSKRAFSALSGGVLIALFSRETLVSHGMVYWPHSLYQIFLGSLLLCLCHWLMNGAGKLSGRGAWLIFVLAYTGGLVEWSGVLFSLTAALAIYCSSKYRNNQLSLILVAAAATSIATIFAHYSLALGAQNYVFALAARFLRRSAANASVVDLFKGYALSYGAWIITCIVATFLAGVNRIKQAFSNPGIRMMLLLCMLPLLENLLMLQHASQFSFDRLKAIFPIGLYLSICISLLATSRIRVLLIIFIAASMASLYQYERELKVGEKFWSVHHSNIALANEIKRHSNLECSSLSSNMKVRGYDNILFDRAIHGQRLAVNDAVAATGSQAKCMTIWIEGVRYATDIPKYQQAVIRDSQGATKTIHVDDLK